MSVAPESGNAIDAPPRTRRWVWPLLIISLALNLLFVGLMAGSLWRHGGPGGRHKVFTGAVEKLMKELPEEKRTIAANLLDQHREGLRPVRQQLREARKAAKEAVVTEPFDKQKAESALSRFREIKTSQHESMHTMIMGLLTELNLEERNKLLENIQAGFKARRRHRKVKD